MKRRVIVIGFDGLDPSLLRRMMGAGRLPSFARLRDLGTATEVATTTPAQTPSAWSTFATGLNPGGHGIFDFLKRDPATYLPDLGLVRHQQRNALLPPQATNLRSGRTAWEYLSDAGIPATVLRCPCTYPPGAFKGRLLSGMGVPDLRGGIGTTQFFSTATGTTAGEGEIVHVLRGEGPVYQSRLLGPRRPGTDDLSIALSLAVDADGSAAALRLGERAEATRLHVGEWSDLQPVTFRAGALTSLRGALRFLLVRTSPAVELHASPVGFAPTAPPFPISHPWSYAAELEGAIGSYDTLGMPEDHTGLTNGRLSEDAFLAQCEVVLREREAMLRHELNRFERGLLYCLFDTPDRIQHMFWRFGMEGHPANRVHGADPRYRSVIPTHYERLDRILGEVMHALDGNTTLVVLSDHGFTSFERGVHLNAWLADHGWLALKPGESRGSGAGSFLRSVDWGRTRAYALGFGAIYLNVAGREGAGIVPAGERRSVAAHLARELGGLMDVERGEVAVQGASTADQLYSGARAAEAPDVVVRFSRGYRASWDTALGGIAVETFEDNTRRWGGDHIVDPSLVPGVLLVNRSDLRQGAALADMAPTILTLLGAPVPPGLDGRSLLLP